MIQGIRHGKRLLVIALLVSFVSGAALGFWFQQLRETNYIPLGALDDYGRELTHCWDQLYGLKLVAGVTGASAATTHYSSTFQNCLAHLSLRQRHFNDAERSSFERLVAWAEQNHPGLYCDASSGRCPSE
jgi:hypothetical protein